MPIDPQQCRDNASLCRELAERNETPVRAQIFLNLAKQWVQLAAQLERAQERRDESEPISPRRLH
jgi:seryl-tRNA synthetase